MCFLIAISVVTIVVIIFFSMKSFRSLIINNQGIIGNKAKSKTKKIISSSPMSRTYKKPSTPTIDTDEIAQKVADLVLKKLQDFPVATAFVSEKSSTVVDRSQKPNHITMDESIIDVGSDLKGIESKIDKIGKEEVAEDKDFSKSKSKLAQLKNKKSK